MSPIYTLSPALWQMAFKLPRIPMAQHTPIRRHHPFTRIPADGSEHPPFRTCPQDAIEAKNLRMSHLSTQHVRVSFLDTLYAKDRKRFIARCVPFSLRHEYESS